MTITRVRESYYAGWKISGAVTYVLVSDYSKYNWTMFDPEAKKVRHEEVFPDSMKKAFEFGAEMVSKPWE